MFIIWGSTELTRSAGEGTFYCPRCRALSGYSHQQVKEYFTLYFIPLFSTRLLGECIVCKECGGDFPPSIRERSQEQLEALYSPWRCAGCQGLNPPAEIRCLSCKERRPSKYAADQVAPTPGGQSPGTVRDTLPKPGPTPSRAKPSSDSAELAAIMAANKCRDCGVANSLVALHCKGCGRKLGAS